MSEQAARAIAQGRAMVAGQKEREAMQIQSGEGRAFSPAEQAVLDLTSNPQKNVEVVQRAIDQAVAEGAAMVELKEANRLQEEALREAAATIEDLKGNLRAAREVNVASVRAEQEAKEALAQAQERLAAVEAEMAKIREARAAAVPVVGESLTPTPLWPPLGESLLPPTDPAHPFPGQPAFNVGADPEGAAAPVPVHDETTTKESDAAPAASTATEDDPNPF